MRVDRLPVDEFIGSVHDKASVRKSERRWKIGSSVAVVTAGTAAILIALNANQGPSDHTQDTIVVDNAFVVATCAELQLENRESNNVEVREFDVVAALNECIVDKNAPLDQKEFDIARANLVQAYVD